MAQLCCTLQAVAAAASMELNVFNCFFGMACTGGVLSCWVHKLCVCMAIAASARHVYNAAWRCRHTQLVLLVSNSEPGVESCTVSLVRLLS